MLGRKTEEQKRMRELAHDIKELRRQLLSGRTEKKRIDMQMKELKEALHNGGILRQGYVDSQEHLAFARRGLIDMLENMSASPAEDVKKSLDELNGHLALIYHACSIRTDDIDFRSTAEGLKNMAAHMEQTNPIMLRSELENLQALLEDTSEWRSPNFFALAYFTAHEDESRVGEMENEYRNDFLLNYLKEHLMDELTEEANEAGVGQKLTNMIQKYIYE